MRQLLGICYALYIVLSASSVSALPLVWGNSAGGNKAWIYAFDPESGKLVHEFMPSNQGQSEYWSGDAGRGIAVDGDIIYFTTLGSGKVFKTNTRGEDLGYVFDTGYRGLGTLAYDNIGKTFFVTNDDLGTQDEMWFRRYSADGTPLAIYPNLAGGEVWNNHILAGDDVYDFGGRYLGPLSDFGSVFNGFYRGSLGRRSVALHDWNGVRLASAETEMAMFSVEERAFSDVAVGSYAAVPEPGTLALLLLGLIPLAMGWRRRRA
ncbi:MAG TPA: PEP-CTERM sorting domain-containing protein [Fibrobacteria bacterium]|nr:PEP-CTERM sorting domain-containing protein [Fibrobacteria bacterium]